MAKILALIYGVVNHLTFVLIFLYFICFLGNFTFDSLIPKTIDSGTPGPWGIALLVNVLLLLFFAVPHSVMARPGFKRWWTQFVPTHLERSTYVLQANLLVILLFWQWQPMTGVVWEVQNPLGANLLWALFFLGFGIVLLSSFIIDHFDLFGTRHVILYALGRPYTSPQFKVRGPYKFVRHPLLLGWHLAFWATPLMTTGHLVFSIATTAYMLIAIQYEEKDLATYYGEDYVSYRRKVSMLIPWPSKK